MRKKETHNSPIVGELNPKQVIDALLDDPDIISAEFKDGEFHVLTTAGQKSFKLSFKKDNGARTD